MLMKFLKFIKYILVEMSADKNGVPTQFVGCVLPYAKSLQTLDLAWSIVVLNDSCNKSQESLNFSTCLPQNVQQFAFLVDLTILPDLVSVCIR